MNTLNPPQKDDVRDSTVVQFETQKQSLFLSNVASQVLEQCQYTNIEAKLTPVDVDKAKPASQDIVASTY
jgi:hypothetical protein